MPRRMGPGLSFFPVPRSGVPVGRANGRDSRPERSFFLESRGPHGYDDGSVLDKSQIPVKPGGLEQYHVRIKDHHAHRSGDVCLSRNSTRGGGLHNERERHVRAACPGRGGQVWRVGGDLRWAARSSRRHRRAPGGW